MSDFPEEESLHPIKTAGHPDRRLYQPQSARLYNSPYLYPPFQPMPPDNGMRLTRNARRSVKTPRRYDNYVPYNGTPYRPPEVEQTYVERTKYFAKRDKDWNERIVRKYTKKETLPAYRTSMKGTYNRVMIQKKKERVRQETYAINTASDVRRRRMIRQSEESMRAHEEIMRRNGVQPPASYNW